MLQYSGSPSVSGRDGAPDSLRQNDSTDNAYARILRKMAQQHRLLSVHWELTNRCNEKCSHCYLDVLPAQISVPHELTTAQAQQLIDEIADLGALFLTFSGGEIFLRRDFFQIAEYARRKRLAIRLMTNGILIAAPLADRIADLRPTGVEMSVYGADAITHESITRRPRSFELTLRAFRLLRARGIATTMKTPLMRENIKQLDALRQLAAQVGATFHYDPTITAKDNGDIRPLKHRLTHDDLVWLYRQEISAETSLPPTRDGNHRSCGIGSHSLVVDPYGNLFPCIQTRLAAGNVLQQSLREIWATASIFSETAALTLSQLAVCASCELNRLCNRCHANALVECGDLRAPAEANCREALARRQVYIEKRILPSDFPIPTHLQNIISRPSLAAPDDPMLNVVTALLDNSPGNTASKENLWNQQNQNRYPQNRKLKDRTQSRK